VILPFFVGRREDREGKASAHLRCNKLLNFGAVFGGSGVWSEQSAQRRNLGGVTDVGLPDVLSGHSARETICHPLFLAIL
jgi:hypothetical protein